MAIPHKSLAHLSEQELLDRFEDLVVRDRRTTVELLVAMAEIDERKLWARHACSSMFTFCMKRYRMSEQATAKRLRAARTARRYPLVLAMLERGELHLSAIQRLAGHLTEDNHAELLGRAKHRTSREVERLVAEIAPKSDVPSRIRALPKRGLVSAPADGLEESSRDPSSTAPEPEPTGWERTGPGWTGRASRDEGAATPQGGPCPADPSERRASWPSRAGSVTRPVVALAPRRYKIEVTVDETTHDKLRSLQDLLGRTATGRDPAAIISRAIDVLLRQTLTRKAAHTDRPRAQANAAVMSARRRTRGIPAAVRREVWQRDCGRCRYVDALGRRCDETRNIEFHHRVPFARGGRHAADNLELRCAPHNQYQADLDFGRAFMDRRRGVAAGTTTFPEDCPAAGG